MTSLTNPRRRRLISWVLAVSLCVNAGIVAAIVARQFRSLSPPPVDVANPELQSTDTDDFAESASRPELVRRLNLDTNQRSQMAALKRELMTSTAALHRQAMEERRRLMVLLRADPMDESAVRASLKRIQTIQAETQETVVDHVVAERKLLRPDQVGPFNAIVLPRVFGGVLGAGPAVQSDSHRKNPSAAKSTPQHFVGTTSPSIPISNPSPQQP